MRFDCFAGNGSIVFEAIDFRVLFLFLKNIIDFLCKNLFILPMFSSRVGHFPKNYVELIGPESGSEPLSNNVATNGNFLFYFCH